MNYVFFLGSNPALSAAEVWRALAREGTAPRLQAATDAFILLETNRELPANFLQHLGGSHRIGRVLGGKSSPWTAADILTALSPLPPKLRVGISMLNGQNGEAQRLGLQLKQAARTQGTKLRFVSPSGKTGQLNAAQVLFNRLYEHPHRELTLLRHEEAHYLIQTEQIQDIAAYERRDTSRPARDPRVGMLPPKLAQIMLNLIPAFPSSPPKILDPFCGMGTVLQEGYLMGHAMTGSDRDPRMVAASQKNLEWLQSSQQTAATTGSLPTVFQHDIRKPFGAQFQHTFDAIVTEPYLGEPISTPPPGRRAGLPAQEISPREKELAGLYLDFFHQAREVLKPGGAIIFLLPCWRQSVGSFKLFSPAFLDEVKAVGYDLTHLLPNELQEAFQGTDRGTIVYARPDAQVGREVTLWQVVKNR